MSKVTLWSPLDASNRRRVVGNGERQRLRDSALVASAYRRSQAGRRGLGSKHAWLLSSPLSWSATVLVCLGACRQWGTTAPSRLGMVATTADFFILISEFFLFHTSRGRAADPRPPLGFEFRIFWGNVVGLIYDDADRAGGDAED